MQSNSNGSSDSRERRICLFVFNSRQQRRYQKAKYRYNKDDIKHINNFDIDRYNTLDVEQKDDILDLVCELIDEFELANVRELKRFVAAVGPQHGLANMKVVNRVIRSHTGLIRLYFDGVYQRKTKGRNVDFETGELIDRNED